MAPDSRRSGMTVIILGLLSGTFLVRAFYPINHDVSYFLYIARLILEGGTQYVDLIDHNLPLATQILLPVVMLSDWAGLPIDLALTSYIMVLVVVAWALCMVQILRWNIGDTAKFWIAAILIAGFCYLPGYFFAQREHLFTILIAPYLVAMASRSAGQTIPTWFAVISGVLAGLSIGVKPHFVLVPAVMEAMLLLQRQHKLLRAENLSLLATVTALTVYVLVVYPEWAGQIVPAALSTYGAYNEPILMVAWLIIITILFSLVYLLCRRNSHVTPSIFRILMFSILGSLFIYVLQRKGWLYHSYPLIFFIFLLFCAALASWDYADWRKARYAAPALVASVLLGFLVYNIARLPDRTDLEAMSGRVQNTTGAILVLSTGLFPGFPLVLEEKRRWASRFPGLGYLPQIATNDRAGERDQTMARWEASMRSHLVSDIKRNKPSIIFVPGNTYQAQGLPEGFDILEWLLRDPDFVAAWSRYRASGRTPKFLVYERIESS